VSDMLSSSCIVSAVEAVGIGANAISIGVSAVVVTALLCILS